MHVIVSCLCNSSFFCDKRGDAGGVLRQCRAKLEELLDLSHHIETRFVPVRLCGRVCCCCVAKVLLVTQVLFLWCVP